MKHPIDAAAYRKRRAHVMFDEFKRRPIKQVLYVLSAARDQVVQCRNLVSGIDKPIAQV